jgi:LysM domain/WxL Interacting Protein, peptidoglycan binding domain
MIRHQIRTISLITIVALSIMLLPMLARAEQSNEPIKIELNPTNQPNEDKPTLTYEIKPTKSIEDVLTIHNYSNTQDYSVKLYAVDAIQSSNGASAFKLQEKEQKQIGNWITLNTEDTNIAAGETTYIPYRIDIPEKSTPGTYQGGLVTEILKNGKEEKTANKEQVKVVTRFIEPIFVSIPGRKKINYKLDKFEYQEEKGKPGFYIKFSNNGNVFLKGEIDLEIEGTLLPTPYQISLNKPAILQDESLEKSFFLENPPFLGIYTAKITIQVCEYDVVNDELKIIETIHKELTFTIIPYGSILGLLILIIFFIVTHKWHKKYLQKRLENTFKHKVKKGENVISLGKLYKVNWKKIAKLNKLHSPYTITPGDVLTLPFPPKTKPQPPKKK